MKAAVISSAETTSDIASSIAPDWKMVPFDVGCARCGHDLHGQSEPACPACKLEFDWADAVPIERLTCSHCDYHLYGLEKTRCPECGTAFTWEEALAAYHRKRLPLFEYRWRERPVRSFVGTCFRSLRPTKFWVTTDIHAPVRVIPLIAFATACLVCCMSLTIVLRAELQWLAMLRWSRISTRLQAPGAAEFASYVLREFRRPETWAGLISIFSWTVAVLASLLVFQQSMRRRKVKNSHVVRVWAYNTALLPLTCLIGILVAPAIKGLFRSRMFGVPSIVVVILLVTLSTGWATSVAYRRYLRIPHSAGIAFASQIMTVLVASILDIALSTAWSRGGLFKQMWFELFAVGAF